MQNSAEDERWSVGKYSRSVTLQCVLSRANCLCIHYAPSLSLSLFISAYRFVVRHMSVWLFWCSLRFVCHSFHFSRTLYACACFHLQAYCSGVEQMHRNWKKEILVGWFFLFDFFFATFSHTIFHSFPAHAIHSSIFCSVFVTRYCHHCEEREKKIVVIKQQ